MASAQSAIVGLKFVLSQTWMRWQPDHGMPSHDLYQKLCFSIPNVERRLTLTGDTFGHVAGKGRDAGEHPYTLGQTGRMVDIGVYNATKPGHARLLLIRVRLPASSGESAEI